MNLQLERLQSLCTQLRLLHLPDHMTQLSQMAAKQELGSLDFLEHALQAETQVRQERTRATLTQMAGFPAIKTLDDYDFAFARRAPKPLIQE